MIPEGALSNLVIGLTALVGEQEQRRIVERENYTRGTMLAQVVAALVHTTELQPVALTEKGQGGKEVALAAREIAHTAFLIVDAVEAEAKKRIGERRKSQQPTAPGGEA
jgi:hypothetical protein